MSPDHKPALPDAWVSKIFDLMAASYGSKFLDLWRGTNLLDVKRHWAEKLGGFADRPEAIKLALDALDEKPFPPTLPEFIALCRENAKRLPPKHLALEQKMTPEQIAANKARIREIVEGLGKAKAMPK